jgi:hypothetical protein
MLNPSAVVVSPTKKAALWTLICLEILGGLIAIPWLPVGLFISCTILDAPGSRQLPFLWFAWLLALGWPWMFIAASVTSWWLFKQGWPWIGILLTAVTLAPAAFICVSFAVASVNEGISVEDRWARIKQAKARDTFADPLQQRLAESVSRGDVPAIEAALRDGADANARGKHDLTMLLWAVAKQSLPAFELLLKNGADIKADLGESYYNTWGGSPKTVVEQIVIDDDPGFLRVAIAHGLGPNHIPDQEWKKTLLQLAIEVGATKNIDLLINEGADINHKSTYRGPPLDDAFAHERYDIVLLLLKRDADVEGSTIADRIRETEIRRVKPEQLLDYTQVVEELRKRGVLSDVEAKDAFTPKQVTPLTLQEF